MTPFRPTLPALCLALCLGPTAGPAGAANGNGAAAPAPPAPPAAAPAPTLSDLGRSLRSYFTEEELNLLFQYMRDSVIAAFKGEEVFLPPDLSFKLEILLARMKKEGGHYMDNLIRQLERDLERNLKEKLKEKLAPPDTSTSPYVPPQPPVLIPLFVPPAWSAPPASPGASFHGLLLPALGQQQAPPPADP